MTAWDVARSRKRGLNPRPTPVTKTEVVRCPVSGCPAESRVLVGSADGWIERHLDRRHPVKQDALF